MTIRHLFTFLFLVALSLNLQAQVPPGAAPQKLTDRELGEFYLKKSKNQKTIGWSMLGGGLLLYTIGISTAYDNSESGVGAASLIIGSFAMLGSIPLFISSARNKGRAEVLLRFENIPLSHIPQAPRSIPAIGMRFNLSR